MVNYYSIKNEPAAAEYIERVGPVICKFMKGKGYEAFAVGMTHGDTSRLRHFRSFIWFQMGNSERVKLWSW